MRLHSQQNALGDFHVAIAVDNNVRIRVMTSAMENMTIMAYFHAGIAPLLLFHLC